VPALGMNIDEDKKKVYDFKAPYGKFLDFFKLLLVDSKSR
jgi:hypothetical protein